VVRFDERERPAKSTQTADTGMGSRHFVDLGDLEVRGVHQSVDTLDALDEFEASADVESRARRGGQRDVVQASDLATRQIVRVHDEQRRRASVRVDQFGGKPRLDPLRAEHRRRREPCDHAASPRPQPCRLGALSCRKLDSAHHMNAWIRRHVEAAKLADGQRIRVDGLPAAYRPGQFVPHERSLPTIPDTEGRLCGFVHRRGVSRTTPRSRGSLRRLWQM
jgi:hypothetical protein